MRRLRHVIADIPELARFAARLGDEDFPTADELAEARSILAEAKACVRVDLFSAPPHAGVATGGQPEPSGLADCGCPGPLGSQMNSSSAVVDPCFATKGR